MLRVRYSTSMRAGGMPAWLPGLIGAGIVVVAVATLFLGLLVSILLIPVAIIGSFIFSWRLRTLIRAANRQMQTPPGRDRIIEGDYIVLKDSDHGRS